MSSRFRTWRYLPGKALAATRRRKSPKVAIIGAGFGGIGAAVSLRRSGIDDLVIIEGSDGVGGTWRRNTYPGAACDVQTALYSFSFALNKSWSRTYAQQPEILEYLEAVVDDFDVRRHLMLNTQVRRARWNEQTWQWELELHRAGQEATTLVADVVVSAVGLFGEPKLPDIDGLGDYRGIMMHTSAWDHEADLAGKNVAVIGTGASAVQAVPELAKTVAHLSVFQRTPPWMVPKEDRPFTEAELTRFRWDPTAIRRERWKVWKFLQDNTATMADDPIVASRSQYATGFLNDTVPDEQLRSALTPDYPFRCKRVLLGDSYYLALQQPHVDLITDPIQRVEAGSIVTRSGAAVDVDAIVLATGFETSSYLSGIEVIGRGGEDLHQRWGDDPMAYLGVAVSGFPNFFMLYGPNTNQAGNSVVYVLEAGARLVAGAVRRLARRGGKIEVSAEAEERFNNDMAIDLERTVWTQCHSYFRSPTGRIVTQWPYTALDYSQATRRLRPGDWIHHAGAPPAVSAPANMPSDAAAAR